MSQGDKTSGGRTVYLTCLSPPDGGGSFQRWSNSKSQIYQELHLSIKQHSRIWTHQHKVIHTRWAALVLSSLLRVWCVKTNVSFYISCLCRSIWIFLCASISTSQLCVCVWDSQPFLWSSQRTVQLWLWLMMDIWKLNWLMAPPSQQPAGRPLAEIKEVCVCEHVCKVGRWASMWRTLHLASHFSTH